MPVLSHLHQRFNVGLGHVWALRSGSRLRDPVLLLNTGPERRQGFG
jgi:hypothetical protein